MSDDVLSQFAESASNDFGRLLQSAAASMNSAVFQKVTSQGHPQIRPSHVAMFVNLDVDGTHISVLAERAGISRQAMGVIVREVERLGYITTELDVADRRATIVQLTARGVEFCVLAIAVSDEWNASVATLLGAEQAELMRQQLRQISGMFTTESRNRV